MKKFNKNHLCFWYEQTDLKNNTLLSGILSTIKFDINDPSIICHEQTCSELINNNQIKLSKQLPLYLVYSDDNKLIEQKIKKIIDPSHCIQKKTDQFLFKQFKINSPIISSWIYKMINKKKFLLADGHHRYEVIKKFYSTINYKIFIRNIPDPNSIISPFYRTCHLISESKLKIFFYQLCHYFEPIKYKNKLEFLNSIKIIKNGIGMICNKKEYYLIKFKKNKKLDDLFETGISKDYKMYSGNIIDEVFIKKFLNKKIDSKNILYDTSIEKVFSNCEQNKNYIAFLHNGISLKNLIKIAKNKELLNIKSTHFIPKLSNDFFK